MSVCFGKNFCTSLLMFTKLSNFSVLEYKIYLAFGMLQILYLLCMENFLGIQYLFWGWCLPYFLISVVINFLVALEEAYKSGLDRKVTLFLSCIIPLVIASVLELNDCSHAGKSILFLATF